MSRPKTVEFDLTPDQMKVMAEIVDAANRSKGFCVIAQIKLLEWPGSYDRAVVQARMVGMKSTKRVQNALVRAGVIPPKRKRK